MKNSIQSFFLLLILTCSAKQQNIRKNVGKVSSYKVQEIPIDSSGPSSFPTSLISSFPSSGPSSGPSSSPSFLSSTLSPSSGPTRMPSTGPSIIPSNPSMVPICVPSTMPSTNPSSFASTTAPVSQKYASSGPTSFPSNIPKLSVSVTQYLTGVACTLIESESGQKVFLETVSTTANVTVDEVFITNITCVQQAHSVGRQSKSRISIKSSSQYIVIDYVITPAMNNILVCQSIAQTLQVAVNSGTFISNLKSIATTSSVAGFSEAQTSIATVSIQGAPSSIPSSGPQQSSSSSSSNSFFSNKTSVGVTFAFVGLAVILLLCIALYWYRKSTDDSSRQFSSDKIIALDEPVNPTDQSESSFEPTKHDSGTYMYNARSALVRVFSNQFSNTKSARVVPTATTNDIDEQKPLVFASFIGLFSTNYKKKSPEVQQDHMNNPLTKSIELQTATKRVTDVEAPTTTEAKKNYYDYYQQTYFDSDKPIGVHRGSSLQGQASASMQLSGATDYSQNSANTATSVAPEYNTTSDVIYDSNPVPMKVVADETNTNEDVVEVRSSTPLSPSSRPSFMSNCKKTESEDYFPSNDIGGYYPAKKGIF